MATEALIVATLDVELDKARARINEFVREVEQRQVRLNVSANVGDRSTLGGQVVAGRDPETVAGPDLRRNAPGGFNAQQAIQQQWYAPASSLGGYVGQASGRPVPTASQNSQYGSVGHGFTPMGPFGGFQPLPSPSRTTFGSGADPYGVAAGPAAPFTAATRAIVPWRAQAASGGYSPPLVTPAPGVPLALPSPTDRGMLAVQQAAAGVFTGGVTPVTARRVGGGPPPAYPSGGMSLGGGAFPSVAGSSYSPDKLASIVTAFTYVAAIADQQMTTVDRSRDRNRFDSVAAAAQADYQEQRGVTGIRRAVGGLFNTTAGYAGYAFGPAVGDFARAGVASGGFIDDASIADARDAALQATAQEEDRGIRRETQRQRRINALAGTSGAARQIGLSRIATDDLIAANNDAARDNRFLLGTLTERNNVLREGQSLADAEALRGIGREGVRLTAAAGVIDRRASGDTVGAARDELSFQQQERQRELQRTVRGMSGPEATMLRAGAEQRDRAERSAFERDVRDQSSFRTSQINLGTRASEQALAGSPLAANLTAIDAGRRQQLQQRFGARFNSDLGDVVDPFTLTIQEAQERNAINSSARQQAAVALVQEQQRRTLMVGSTTAMNLAAGFRPLEAQKAEIKAQRDAALKGVTDPGEIGRINANANAQLGLVESQFGLGSLNVGMSLATQRGQTAALMRRDPYGAEAIGIAGAAISDATGLFTGGFKDAARERLALGQDQLRLAQQQQGDAFRAREVGDPFYFALSARDSFDPTDSTQKFKERFAAIDDIRKATDGEFLNEAGKAGGTIAGVNLDSLKQIIIEALRQAAAAPSTTSMGGDGPEGGGWTS